MNRRTLLTSAALAPVVVALSNFSASAAMMTPWDWIRKNGLTGHMPKDSEPTKNEFEKYPRCPYCGMVRKQWSHTRHLIQYDDDATEGTCSIHCLSLSMGLNMDRSPKSIWVGDAGSDAEIKPLIKVEDAHYAIDPNKPGTMSAIRKWAFADPVKAADAGAERVVTFEDALEAAYHDMAKNTLMIRKRRAEKRAHMNKKADMAKGKDN